MDEKGSKQVDVLDVQPAAASNSIGNVPLFAHPSECVADPYKWGFPPMGKLTGTQHGDAANALFAFYADKAQELEEAGQYFMARHRLGLSGSRRAYCDEVLGLLEKGVGVHRRLIGESLTIELALDRLTKEHLDGQDTGIRADARALEPVRA